MKTTDINKRSLIATPLALAAALALAACSPRDEGTTVGQQVDRGVAAAKEGAQEAKQAGERAADKVANAAGDATITTKINAALAADDQLKALQINVDTNGGKVVLNGTAPSAAAKERATTLARAVDGVVDVDNRLSVSGG